jgi:uncharacterized protein
VKLLSPSDYRIMPWKNGLGSTTELWRADDPEGRMAWRVSIAGVTEDGPFSPFPGYDRHILALEGEGLKEEGTKEEGMELDGGPDGPIRVAPAFTPRCFSGDWPITARLLGGPLTDFNLIIRRDWGSGELMVWEGATSAPQALSGKLCLLWVQAGTLELAANPALPASPHAEPDPAPLAQAADSANPHAAAVPSNSPDAPDMASIRTSSAGAMFRTPPAGPMDGSVRTSPAMSLRSSISTGSPPPSETLPSSETPPHSRTLPSWETLPKPVLSAGEACLLEPGEAFTLVPSPGSRIIACVVQPAR